MFSPGEPLDDPGQVVSRLHQQPHEVRHARDEVAHDTQRGRLHGGLIGISDRLEQAGQAAHLLQQHPVQGLQEGTLARRGPACGVKGEAAA